MVRFSQALYVRDTHVQRAKNEVLQIPLVSRCTKNACVRAGAKLNVTPSAPFDRRGLQWHDFSDEKGGIFKLPGLSVHKFRLRGLRQKKRAPLHVHSLADLTLELRLPLCLHSDSIVMGE